MRDMMFTTKGIWFGMTLVLGVAFSGPSIAFEDNDMFAAEAQIEYRQGVMRAIGGNAASLAAILVDGADEYRGNLETHARFIRDMTEDIPSLFPEGSDFGDTDALDEVWENRDEFEQRAEDTHEAAVAFDEAVEAGNDDEIGPRFRELGESCTACHDDFRRGE